MSIKHRRKGKKKLAKVIAYSSGIALGLGGLSYAVIQNMGKVTADKYGCFKQVPVSQPIHVLVDASQPRYSPEQQLSIYRYMEQLFDELALGGKISVYTSENDQIASIAKPRFHVCGLAKKSEELVEINAAEASIGYLAKQKQRLYTKKFLPELKILLSGKPDEKRKASSSPLLEMIKDISHLSSMKSGSKLVVISDLLQNSSSVKPFCYVKNALPKFSTYSQWDVYKNLLKPKSFAGVEVDVLMLQRPAYGEYCTEQELRQYWIDYFKANGVKNPNFLRIRAGVRG